jgi:peptide-methionine (S)-S-oxide reductase
MQLTPYFAFSGTVVLGLCILAAAHAEPPDMSQPTDQSPKQPSSADLPPDPGQLEQATFGTGCFWCSEALFEQLRGVVSVESGYAGGGLKNPTYEQVCSGLTGHAEVVQVIYDPNVISYSDLLEIFWKTHDPTTLNRQGNDVGTQYRSAVFYHNDQQRKLAEHFKKKLNGVFRDAIVTEIAALEEFYPAEKYHQDYYRSNPAQGYCTAVIRPKVDKLKQAFADKLPHSPPPSPRRAPTED